MDELDKGLQLSIKGDLHEEALKQFEKQIKKWRVTLPKVEPLVLDFGQGDFYNTGLIEYWIANELDADYCAKYLFVFPGQSCPVHRHEKKHETFYLIKGRVEMAYNGKTFEMKAGDVLPVEPNKFHGFTGNGSALLLEVSKSCIVNDNFFENKNINF